ncbi:hypothetical protein FRX31_033035 [Thalictrum thalictroides]|uniref:K Homology domain-containing protein n=1 Tax=Thalictrum thalictroides TaxID=46969 RepID=A0A7J6UY77_THATH|nr:hypothetical protein FRX31_033035 [Thalictrum thalictroides]
MWKGEKEKVHDEGTRSNTIRLENRFEELSSLSGVIQKPACQMNPNLQVALAPYIKQKDSLCGNQGTIKRIVIPSEKAGLIIGRGGKTLDRLQDESGARILIARPGGTDPCCQTRNIDLIGKPQQIRSAEQFINHLILEGFNAIGIKNISGIPLCATERFTLVEGFKVNLKYYDLYKAIKAQYGDIRRPSILDASEMAVVAIVSDLLSIVYAMCQISLLNVTSDILDDWDKKICLAENFDYNVSWIRDHFEELQIEFERKERIEAEVSECSSSDIIQNGLESVAAVLSSLTSHLESAKESLSVLQSKGEASLAWISKEERENSKLRCSGSVTGTFRLLSCFLTSTFCFFCVFMYAIMFP